MSVKPRRRRASGYTVLELMVTVTVLGILASLAIPSVTDFFRNNRRSVLVNELLASLMLARSEAARTGQPIVVCGVHDADDDHVLDLAERSCTGTDGSDGWMVATWTDADNDGVLDAGELAAPMRIYMNDYGNFSVTGSGFTAAPAAGAAALMPFNRSGTSGRITVCDPRGAGRARAVDLAASGRPSVLLNSTEY